MRKNTQSGFSLVELMVVVAIIGILATIAIPKVNKFIAKARSAEAQVNLASLYTFDKNFYVEFQGYTSSFGAMGLVPEGKLRYAYGWTAASGTAPPNYLSMKGIAATTPATDTEICGAGVLANGCMLMAGADNVYPTLATGSALAGNFSTFTAMANAVLQVTNGTATPDVWSIDETKNLKTISDGTQ